MDSSRIETQKSKSTNSKTEMIEDLTKQDERNNYFRAWPMLNMYNRRMEAGIRHPRLFAFPAEILT